MRLFTVLMTCCLLCAWQVNGFTNNLGINDLTQHTNQLRRQLAVNQNALTDAQHHHSQTYKENQQPLFLQQAQSIEVPTTEEKQHFLTSPNAQPNNFQQNSQFPRTDQSHLQKQHQYPNIDLHTQNFLTLRNYANQQSLPHRSPSNTQFQSGSSLLTHQQQSQHPNLLSNAFQQQQLQSEFGNGLAPTLKVPSEIPVLPYQPSSLTQKPNSQLSFQQLVGLQQLPSKQLHPNFQVTPNLGLPVSQIFPLLPSNSLPQQQHQSLDRQQDFKKQQFSTQPQQHSYFQANQPQNSDQDYKQKLIQKHEQFVQKQYEKSQNKVRQQHEDFLAKQQAIKEQALPTIRGSNIYGGTNYNPHLGRPVSPVEYPIFSSALQKYHNEHPTTTTSTTTTTTTAEHSTDKIKHSQNESPNFMKTVKTIGRDELLKQLKAALAEVPQKELGNKTYDEMDLVLPNGQRVQVIRTTDPNIVQGTELNSQFQLKSLVSQPAIGSEPGKLTLEDVAPVKSKDLVLPNGSKIQILRSPDPKNAFQNLPSDLDLSKLTSLYGNEAAGTSYGANSIASSAIIQSDSDEPPSLEELAKRGLIPEGYEIEGLSSLISNPQPKPANPQPKKKATYVYLEEQADGSFKIQGVKANGEKETKQTGAEVESILERIRNGDIKLPPSVHRLKLPNDEEVEVRGSSIIKTTIAPRSTESSSTVPPKNNKTFDTSSTEVPFRRQSPSTDTPLTATQIPEQSSSNYHQAPQSLRGYKTNATPNNGKLSDKSVTYVPSTSPTLTERLITAEQKHYSDTIVQETENKEKSEQAQATMLTEANHSEHLIQILKSNGLFAMAKYLRQSGLDSILNETGPYTIFVPTDKAFKNLLVQLGGPERAEEKFKANPRLLSGLLLHHVIPGSFEIANLQDEMTGVSLAGTQLRVNQYTMHDQEWNDVTLTTINGAMIVLNKKDIKIPQGIAHAVDRVMFPLPVGDLLQTLQSDRENRFTTFLKILYTSGLSEKLQSKGVKTYSVFAPVDKSFTDVESDTLEKLFNDKEAAEEYAMKHIVPGTLFSAGMRFYQVKDSLLTGKTVILQKTSAGKIKVNDAQMITSNIPATNGVIHAIDGLLA